MNEIQPAAGERSAAPVARHDLVVEVEALTRRFGKFTAVSEVSFAIGEGEIFGLIGSNGAGKSTLIKMLITLLPPSSGRASVAGFDIARQPAEVRRRVGYVPQMISADGALTAWENMQLSAHLYAIPRAEREERIAEALSMLDLGEAARRQVKTFSGGMIRRLEIAQSLLHRPEMIFLDEPTVGLDPVARRGVWEQMRGLRQSIGATLLMTTHYLEEADALCDRIAIMHLGEIRTIGEPAALKAALGPDASIEDVFAHHTGAEIQNGGGWSDTRRSRRSARRLG